MLHHLLGKIIPHQETTCKVGISKQNDSVMLGGSLVLAKKDLAQ